MAGGRPTKLNEDIQNRIVAAIQRGAYIETAAKMTGITKATFYDWLKKGAHVRDILEKNEDMIITEEQNQLMEFSYAIQKATAESEIRDLAAIDTAAQNGQWQAAAWKLERKHHKRWGRKVAITDHDGGNFFTAMASAWAQALETDDNDSPRRINGDGNVGQ